MKKPGPKRRASKLILWTPELAYIVGLITSDGCLSSDGRHIEFNSKDKSQVETFRDLLKLKNKVAMKTARKNLTKDYYRIQFGNVEFYRWLLNIGLVPKKSKRLGAIIVPDCYFFDFLRGCFDGDGTIYSYWSSQWPNSYVVYFAIVSASPNFLKWLRIKIYLLTGLCGNIVRGGPGTQKLSFGKMATKNIFPKMFYSDDIPCLDRKRLKAETIFRIEELHQSARVEKLVNSQD